MAILITQGIHAGLLSGRIGDVVYVIKNGKNYLRSVATKRSNRILSSLQAQHQTRFKKASTIARQLLPFFRKGHPKLPGGHYPLLMKQLLKLLSTSAHATIDWSTLQLSTGKLHLKLKKQKKENQLEIKLVNGKKGDQYQYLLLDQDGNRMIDHCVKEPEMHFTLPATDGHYHLLMFAVNEEESDCSPTYYLGQYLVENDQATIL